MGMWKAEATHRKHSTPVDEVEKGKSATTKDGGEAPDGDDSDDDDPEEIDYRWKGLAKVSSFTFLAGLLAGMP